MSVQVTYSCVRMWGQEDTGCPYSLEEDFPLNLESTIFQPVRIAGQQAVMTLYLPRVPMVLGSQPHSAFPWVLGILAQVLMCVQQVFLHSGHLPNPSFSERLHLPPDSLSHMWASALAVPIPPEVGGKTERMNS